LPYISKRKSTGAIDCLVAAAMALGRAGGGGAGCSIYEDKDERPGGLLII
jgi:hypothetical protein